MTLILISHTMRFRWQISCSILDLLLFTGYLFEVWIRVLYFIFTWMVVNARLLHNSCIIFRIIIFPLLILMCQRVMRAVLTQLTHLANCNLLHRCIVNHLIGIGLTVRLVGMLAPDLTRIGYVCIQCNLPFWPQWLVIMRLEYWFSFLSQVTFHFLFNKC